MAEQLTASPLPLKGHFTSGVIVVLSDGGLLPVLSREYAVLVADVTLMVASKFFPQAFTRKVNGNDAR